MSAGTSESNQPYVHSIVGAGKKKGAYHHGNLPMVLRKAAVALIAQKGVNGFTLREAAKVAGVTHAAPYRHYQDKAALLAAVAEEGFEFMRDSIQARVEEAGSDPLARFVAIGRAFLDCVMVKPSHFRLMYGPHLPDRSLYPRIQELDEECSRFSQAVIAEGQAAGVIRAGDTRELSVVSFSVMYSVAGAYLDGQLDRLGFTRAESEALFWKGGQVLLEGFMPR